MQKVCLREVGNAGSRVLGRPFHRYRESKRVRTLAPLT